MQSEPVKGPVLAQRHCYYNRTRRSYLVLFQLHVGRNPETVLDRDARMCQRTIQHEQEVQDEPQDTCRTCIQQTHPLLTVPFLIGHH